MVVLGPRPLAVEGVVAVARHRERVEVDGGVAAAMAPARAVVERAVAEERTVYGVTTGFGALAHTRIAPADAERVQQAVVQSHAAGMGEPVEAEVGRAMQLLRARTLAAGAPAPRPELGAAHP